MKIIFSAIAITFSIQCLASVECENKLLKHFANLEINTEKPRITQDYLHPLNKKLSACLNKKIDSPAGSLDNIFKRFEEYEVSDTRKNEIIRVCSAIKAFVSLGLNENDIYGKLLGFQNGWSESMRKPLKSIVETEIVQTQHPVNCNAVFVSDTERGQVKKTPEASVGQKDTEGSRAESQ